MVRLGGLLVGLLAVGCAHAADLPPFAGVETCARCHANVVHAWSLSRHSKMVQPASTAGIQGDFAHAPVTLRGSVYGFRAQGGAFYITESYLTGKPQEHRVQYTLGNRRMQHYLTTLADGRIIVLPPTWDIVRQKWFHNLDIDDPEEAPGIQVQIWNKSCYGCHVSQEEKNFNPEKIAYETKWLDFGIDCERCHSSGAEHAAFYTKPGHTGKPEHDVVVQTRLSAERNTMVCAQCHSFRDILVDNFRAGDNYYDHFLPMLEFSQPASADAAYWPDGRPRRFSTDAYGLWQSECYLKGGTTCIDCHLVPHNTNIDKNPQLKPDINELCIRCHHAEGEKLTAHTHHAEKSTGSSCVECHMPRTVYSIKAEIRDHAMTIPVPENTLHHAIPNACNVCHKDHDANWAVGKMNAWYSPASRQKLIRRADAFAAGRTGNPEAVGMLLAIVSQPSEGPLARANAVGYLGNFSSDPAAAHALMQAFSDPEPVVRAIAARVFNPAPAMRSQAAPLLAALLKDPVAAVRIDAAVALIGMGLRQAPAEFAGPLDLAKQMIRARATLNSDDADQDMAAGRFYMLTSDLPSAIKAFQTSLKLDPEIPVQYLLGSAYAQQGDLKAAKQVLEAIPMSNSQYESAQKLLQRIAGQ